MQLGNARFDQFVDVAFWRRASVRITAALSAALLVLGLLLPDRFAAPMIGAGLTGILAVRLLAMGTGRSPRVRRSTREVRDGAAGNDGGANESRPRGAAAGGWQTALVDDALDDSFAASDSPSRAAFQYGPGATGGHVVGAGA